MARRILLSMMVLLACVALTGAEALAYQMQNLRVGEHGGKTRFVVELAATPHVPDHEIFFLANPNRMVIDLPRGALGSFDKAQWQGAGLVLRYRAAHFNDGISRVVLDLARPVTVDSKLLLSPRSGFGARLVLDLTPTSERVFLANVQPPNEPVRKPKPVVVAYKAPAASAAPKAEIATLPARKSAPAKRSGDRRTVVIDAGHGGKDPGAHGQGGTREKDVVLAFSKEFARQLKATGRYDVYLTRDNDSFIPLRERVAIARRHDADLFVSIHADAISKSTVRGMSVYTLSENASDKEAAALARKENRSDVIAGVDLNDESVEVSDILIDLAQRETKNYSASFARSVISYAGQHTALLERSHRFAGFRVLKAPDVPSVLVELGFLTNRQDEQQLTSPTWRRNVAGSFVKAVDGFFGAQYASGAY